MTISASGANIQNHLVLGIANRIAGALTQSYQFRHYMFTPIDEKSAANIRNHVSDTLNSMMSPEEWEVFGQAFAKVDSEAYSREFNQLIDEIAGGLGPKDGQGFNITDPKSLNLSGLTELYYNRTHINLSNAIPALVTSENRYRYTPHTTFLYCYQRDLNNDEHVEKVENLFKERFEAFYDKVAKSYVKELENGSTIQPKDERILAELKKREMNKSVANLMEELTEQFNSKEHKVDIAKLIEKHFDKDFYGKDNQELFTAQVQSAFENLDKAKAEVSNSYKAILDKIFALLDIETYAAKAIRMQSEKLQDGLLNETSHSVVSEVAVLPVNQPLDLLGEPTQQLSVSPIDIQVKGKENKHHAIAVNYHKKLAINPTDITYSIFDLPEAAKTTAQFGVDNVIKFEVEKIEHATHHNNKRFSDLLKEDPKLVEKLKQCKAEILREETLPDGSYKPTLQAHTAKAVKEVMERK